MARSSWIRRELAAEALVDRRDFIVRAAVLAAGTSSLAALAGCAASQPAPGAEPLSSALVGPGTSLAPIAYVPDLPYWMQGGFAPVRPETDAVDLAVTGSLPPELTGLYVRNGSNPAGDPSPHWFLGDGMVHGVRLDRGRASWYRNRYLRTPQLASGGDFMSGGPPGGAGNQSNVSVFEHAGKILTSGEIGLPYEISPDDLRTLGVHDFGGALTTAMTAHPKIDPATGRMHFFGYGFVPPYLTYHVVAADGTLEYSAEVAVAGPTMIHDFAITETDAVFWELPVVFDMAAAIASLSPDAPADGSSFPFRWDPSYGARIGIMPLEGPTSAIRWVEIDPCYVFHGVNAHREGDIVVIDVCRMPTMFQAGGDPDPNALHRWRVNTSGTELTFTDEMLTDVQVDFPALDRRRTGRSNEQAWFVLIESLDGFPIEFAGLGRRESATGSIDAYSPGPGYRLNEGTFVAGGAGEGEGWLLSYAWDRARDASDLVVFDAMAMSAGPVATVHLPARVPYGFHGSWVPGSS